MARLVEDRPHEHRQKPTGSGMIDDEILASSADMISQDPRTKNHDEYAVSQSFRLLKLTFTVAKVQLSILLIKYPELLLGGDTCKFGVD